jgi:NAD(P)-dependent dehydrogenase (short-subunit alcohol dehydrogenase family)
MRKALVLGASPNSIGEAVVQRLDRYIGFKDVVGYGMEDFDIRHPRRLGDAIVNLQPTDVVYCVGINRLDWIRDVNYSDFANVMHTNVFGFLELIQQLDKRGPGSSNVVVLTSDAAWRPMRTSAVYCASKAALEMAVRVASREYASKGWRINAVAPGKVADTGMTEYVDEKVLELRGWTVEAAEAYELQSTPLGRKVTKAEVAEVVESVLNGPKAQTGEIIAVNGGR